MKNLDITITALESMRSNLVYVDSYLDVLQAENKRLREALEKVSKHDTHNLHNSQGNAYQMAKIAEQALKGE